MDAWVFFNFGHIPSKYWLIKISCYILPNPDIPLLPKKFGKRNNSYSVKGIGSEEGKILYSSSFPKSLILLGVRAIKNGKINHYSFNFPMMYWNNWFSRLKPSPFCVFSCHWLYIHNVSYFGYPQPVWHNIWSAPYKNILSFMAVMK